MILTLSCVPTTSAYSVLSDDRMACLLEWQFHKFVPLFYPVGKPVNNLRPVITKLTGNEWSS